MKVFFVLFYVLFERFNILLVLCEMVSKMYNVSDKDKKYGSKHNQVLMSIVGKSSMLEKIQNKFIPPYSKTRFKDKPGL